MTGMTFADVCANLQGEWTGPPDRPITGLHYDSRQIAPGQVFVAIRGELTDGNRFVPMALRRGAAGVISELAPPPGFPGVWLRVAQARRALATAAAQWYGHPSRRLSLLGMTGTNGKTTTAYLCRSVLAAAGWVSGLFGTIEYRIGDRVIPSPHTTPESLDLQALLAAVAEAVPPDHPHAAVMEVSSHALAMDRVWGCHFACAVFTNLTQDHLDFHGDMENYAQAKRRLFQGTGEGPPACAVVNGDDHASQFMIENYTGRVWRYGLSETSDFRAADVRQDAAGLCFQLQGPDGWRARVQSALSGRVNVYNILAAIAAGYAFAVAPEAILAGIQALERVPGRFERIRAGQPFEVVVDYAHTPDALQNVLALGRDLLRQSSGGRLLTLFGCGGDRDRGKRPLMGRVAAQGSDQVVITSDNPRREDAEAILDDIIPGLQGVEYIREPDRQTAIMRILASARPGDLVLLAGKGHEKVQIIGDQVLPFDDVQVARAALSRLGWSAAPDHAAQRRGADSCN